MQPGQVVLVFVVLLLLGGCSQLSYYTQSVVGHSRLMLAREPVDRVIQQAEQQGDLELAAQLRQSQRMLVFAADALALEHHGSYQSYVPLSREYPVWVVVAAQEFSVEPKQWCYLVIGCASYRGFFQYERALVHADTLREQGLDVVVNGAPAYSTLGWFNDPLLPTMLRYGEAQLAELIFHELAHQRLYINDDSAFNEAFATVVGQHGARLWLQESQNVNLLQDYEQYLAINADFVNLLKLSRLQLAELYSTQIDSALMRDQKEKIFTQLKKRYLQLKDERWGGVDWLDGWFDKPLNNARLAAIATYEDQVPAISNLLKACEEDLNRFYVRLEEASKQPEFVLPDAC